MRAENQGLGVGWGGGQWGVHRERTLGESEQVRKRERECERAGVSGRARATELG